MIDETPVLHVFVRDPRSPLAKSRLAAELGRSFATSLYSAFLDDLATELHQRSFRVVVRVDSPHAIGLFAERFPFARIVNQGDGSLGVRLLRVFHESSDAVACAAIGSDAPLFGARQMEEAFGRLVRGRAHAVLAPARDGGYLLIGFRRGGLVADAFEGIEWSTSKVLDQTVAAMRRAGCEPELLPVGYDIDVAEDVELLAADLSREPERARATARVLRERDQTSREPR